MTPQERARKIINGLNDNGGLFHISTSWTDYIAAQIEKAEREAYLRGVQDSVGIIELWDKRKREIWNAAREKAKGIEERLKHLYDNWEFNGEGSNKFILEDILKDFTVSVGKMEPDNERLK